MTSVSSIKVPFGEEDVVADHSHRKVSFGRRRQYVDCPTSARSLCYVEVADVQTDHQQTLSRQCQTQREVKEMPVQTVSRCELCNRAIQFFASSSAVMQPTIQQAPCVPCPAFLQLLRGSTCCTSCRCVTGIIQVSQQSQQQQTQRVEQSKQDKETVKEQTDRVQSVEKKSYDMLTSTQHEAQDPNLRGVSETKITKFTLGSYCVTPKTHISCQTASKATKKGESEEVKKVKVNAVKKEKEVKKNKNEKDEKKKVKPTSMANKSKSPQKTKLNKDVEPSTDKPEKSFKETDSISKNPTVSPTLETSDSVLEATDSQLENIHKLNPVESKVLIPPPCQVAEMINCTQEIENQSRTKPENPSIFEGNKEDDKQRKIDADQKDEKKSTLTEDSISMDEALNYTLCLNLKENVKKPKVSNDRLKNDKSTVEQVLETDSESQSQAETQTTHTEMTNSATRTKRMYGFRKNNKVEPTKLSYTEVDIQTPDYSGSSNPRKIETAEGLIEEKQTNPERKVINICPVCNRTQVPVSPSSLHYTAHRDKQGRFYCEYCATPNTIKGLCKGEQKRLKCTGCGEYLHTKSSQSTRNKSDNCPRCASIPSPAQSSVPA
ncbi:uncharacterized protein LOC112213182 isoform X3 [Bombus impatiens]|uniref:Uncharacterized protein LOC112213182 isoform X3 n=1 Tax=Bombus impatiens TaxID=132113 RepID=A0A6P8LX05_BOMIM|nr:uncharacterized protein LOC112213182 isoform X3 [Bombus impatiens]